MKITKLTKHDGCTVAVNLVDRPPHHAELRCVDHDIQIQWLSKDLYQEIQQVLKGRTNINNVNYNLTTFNNSKDLSPWRTNEVTDASSRISFGRKTGGTR